MVKALPQHIVQKIRMEVLSGKSKYQVSRELDVSEYTVYSHTSDIPSINRKEPSIRGKNLQHPYGKTEELCRVLGSKYTFTMLFMLEENACRFKDFDTALDNFSQSSLSRRRKKLQILDFIKQKPDRSKRRDIEEYVLTLRGEKFMKYFF